MFGVSGSPVASRSVMFVGMAKTPRTRRWSKRARLEAEPQDTLAGQDVYLLDIDEKVAGGHDFLAFTDHAWWTWVNSDAHVPAPASLVAANEGIEPVPHPSRAQRVGYLQQGCWNVGTFVGSTAGDVQSWLNGRVPLGVVQAIEEPASPAGPRPDLATLVVVARPAAGTVRAAVVAFSGSVIVLGLVAVGAIEVATGTPVWAVALVPAAAIVVFMKRALPTLTQTLQIRDGVISYTDRGALVELDYDLVCLASVQHNGRAPYGIRFYDAQHRLLGTCKMQLSPKGWDRFLASSGLPI